MRNPNYIAALLIANGCATVGSIDRDGIDLAIRNHRKEFRNCFQRYVKKNKNPETFGKIQIRFLIQPNGSAKEVEIKETTFKNQQVPNCVAKAFDEIIFPQPTDGQEVQVIYPFKFFDNSETSTPEK